MLQLKMKGLSDIGEKVGGINVHFLSPHLAFHFSLAAAAASTLFTPHNPQAKQIGERKITGTTRTSKTQYVCLFTQCDLINP